MPSSKYGPLTILVIYWTFFRLSRTCLRTTTATHTGLCPPTIRNTNFTWLESAGVDAGILHPVRVQPKSESLISKEPCWHSLAWSSIRSVKVKHVYQQVLFTIWNGSAFYSWPIILQVTALGFWPSGHFHRPWTSKSVEFGWEIRGVEGGHNDLRRRERGAPVMMTDEFANCTTPAPTATGWWPMRASGWAQRGPGWLYACICMSVYSACRPSRSWVCSCSSFWCSTKLPSTFQVTR